MSRKRYMNADDEPLIPEPDQPAILRSVDADDPPGRLPTAFELGRVADGERSHLNRSRAWNPKPSKRRK